MTTPVEMIKSVLLCLVVAVVGAFGSAFKRDENISVSDLEVFASIFNSEAPVEATLRKVQIETLAKFELDQLMDSSLDVLREPYLRNTPEDHSNLTDFLAKSLKFAIDGKNSIDFRLSNVSILHQVMVLEYFATLYVYHGQKLPHVSRNFLRALASVLVDVFPLCVQQYGADQSVQSYKRALLPLIYSGDLHLFFQLLNVVNPHLNRFEQAVLLDAFISQAGYKKCPDLLAFERGLLLLSDLFLDPSLWNAEILSQNLRDCSTEAQFILSRICFLQSAFANL